MTSGATFSENSVQQWNPTNSLVDSPVGVDSFIPGLGPLAPQSAPVGETIPAAISNLIVEASEFPELDDVSGDRITGQPFEATLSTQADSIAAPDLLAIAFDSTIDHVLGGQTSVTFILQNQGSQDAAEFDVNIAFSDDDILGNEDDQTLQTITLPGLSVGELLTRTVELQLPLAQLNTNALDEDAVGQPTGYVSLNKDFVGLVIDAENAITELSETNNQGQGKGRDLDDVTYFPWDIDGNGQITPTDAVFVINRLGETVDETNAAADFDGNGSDYANGCDRRY